MFYDPLKTLYESTPAQRDKFLVSEEEARFSTKWGIKSRHNGAYHEGCNCGVWSFIANDVPRVSEICSIGSHVNVTVNHSIPHRPVLRSRLCAPQVQLVLCVSELQVG